MAKLECFVREAILDSVKKERTTGATQTLCSYDEFRDVKIQTLCSYDEFYSNPKIIKTKELPSLQD